MKVINLFGGPCAGKSTVAAGLFYLMKTSGESVELVSEYAKQMVWDERNRMFKNQLYLLAKQNHKQDMLRDKVDYCITDCPLLLNLVYLPPNYFESFKSLVWDVWESYENINFHLTRTAPYVSQGRYQTEYEADLVSKKIQDILLTISHHGFNAVEDTHERIYEYLKNSRK